MGQGLSLNLVLLLAMVVTNILSLYRLSSFQLHGPQPDPPVPDHLLHQLATIRATINHLTLLRSTGSAGKGRSAAVPPDLLLLPRITSVASACRHHPDLLQRYMNYTPFSPCPPDGAALAETLVLLGCHPLPRRRCFAASPPPCRSLPCLGFAKSDPPSAFLAAKSALDLTVPQLLRLAGNLSSPVRLALDVGAGTGTLAAALRPHNVTVVSTTMNVGARYSEAVAARGLVPLHVPLQQRLPVADGVLDLVRCGRAVNRWVPAPALEFLLYDADRVLRRGGFLWLDHFFSKPSDLDGLYGPMIRALGYRTIKWATGKKEDSKAGEVYLTALLQKPVKP